MNDREICENILTFLLIVGLLVSFCQIIADLPESFPSLIVFIIGVIGLFALFNACGYVTEFLIDHGNGKKTKRALLNAGKWALLGVCLLTFIHNVDMKGNSTSKSSPPRTYVHKDFDSSTRSYSAPKQDYHPIEFSKTESPPAFLNSTNTGDTLKSLGITNPPNVESYSEMQARLQAEREEFLREWEAESEARWREIEAKHQAEQEKLQAEFEADRKKRAKEHEEFLEKLEQDRLAAERQIEELRYRHHSSAFYTAESVRSLVPEPIPFYTEPAPISSWRSDSSFMEMP